MRVLLDTTALYVAGGVTDLAFTPKVRRLLEDPDTVRLVSPISFIEIAIKANRGLTPFTRKHVESLVFDLNLTVLPISAEHSMGLFGLPSHHHDPFDRALIAIALAESVPLVAKDREFKKYKGLRTMW
ncbi:MAG: type II toxin-antitoxin system VapC family toxin [Acidobacteria bacterium]|nr:type II toxin-antitoxin system VapC family toxin [Acidobacteriota bacterium]